MNNRQETRKLQNVRSGKLRYFFSYFLIFSISQFLTVVFPAFAAPEHDLGLRGEDITLNPAEPIVGKQFRVYAKVHNEGAKDASGFVTFMQGPMVIGTSQVVSVRAGSLADEVFVDWVAPTGQFNILARIQGQEPRDENPANDTALTPMITPLTDTDGDGIPDRDDPDQDNDTVPNSTEGTRGTNPLVVDTDGDKVDDAKDAFPLDPKKSEAPQPPPVVTRNVTKSQPEKRKEVSLPRGSETASSSKEPVVAIALPSDTPKQSEPWVDIIAERVGWNRFNFSFKTNLGDLERVIIAWDFGDYEQARDERIVHTYARSGTYLARLTVITPDGTMLSDTATISFSFFHPRNRQLWGLVIVLCIVAIIPLAWASARRRLDAEEGRE